MFVVEEHIAPRGGEAINRIPSGVVHRPSGFGLHKPLDGGAVDGRFTGGRGLAVFPIGRPIAGKLRQLGAVTLLELAKRLRDGGDDQLGRLMLGVPFLDEIGKVFIWPAVVALHAPAQIDRVVGVARPFQFREPFRHFADQAEVFSMAQRVAAQGTQHKTLCWPSGVTQ